jgi:4-amino-4-deoxy-L-arabinose transferase-like glycosyltransferase
MTQVPSKLSRRASWIALSCCCLLVLLYSIVSYSAVVTKSATYDEPLHAVGAWMHLHFGDFRMNFEDPPLWKYFAAIPNGRGALQGDFRQNPNWLAIAADAYKGFGFATNILYQSWPNDGAAFVNRERFMMMLIGTALAIVIIAWAWKLGGPIAGIIAGVFFCFDPNALGHGPLIKNDISMSLVLTAAFMALWYVGRRMTILNAAALALITAAAVNTKFSALLMGPMIVLALVVRALLPTPWNVLGRELKKVLPRLLVAATLCVAVALVSYVAIWATYGFRYNPTSDPSIALNTMQHKLDLLKYKFQATHTQPAPEPFDPATPIAQLADQLNTALQTVTASAEELKRLLPTAELSENLADELQRNLASATVYLNTEAAEAARKATNFAKNIPPPGARADDFDDQLLKSSREAHQAYENLKQVDFALTMMIFYARHGDKAPDAFTRVLNIGMDHHLLPSAWLHGILFVHARSIIRGSYLMGQIKPTGWWYYFPLAMLFKTPVATILALIGAAVAGALFYRQGKKQWLSWIWPLACLLIPCGVYLLSVMGANLNIGLRHVLPVYPFMYVTGAVLLAWLIRRFGKRALIGAAVLGLMLVIETLAVWPNYIAYFNFAVGGTRNGINLLADSNLDWGQDLPALAAWQKQHPDIPLAFGPASYEPGGGSYFGMVDPTFYGIKSTPLGFDLPPEVLRNNVLAISATLLQGVYGSPFPRFRDRKPIEVLGGTIYLYDLRSGQ